MVVPLSRNQTECAKVRMRGLGLHTEWVGVADKTAAFEAILKAHAAATETVCYVADGREDIPIFERVGLPCAVADAHPTVRAACAYVTAARGGEHALEEIADLIMDARGWL